MESFIDIIKSDGALVLAGGAFLVILANRFPSLVAWIPASWRGGKSAVVADDNRPKVWESLITLRDHADGIAEPERAEALKACDLLAVAAVRPNVPKPEIKPTT